MLGVCVVYLVHGPGGFHLLDLSIAQLERLTAGPYRLYGCCPGNDGETLRRMQRHGVIIQEAPAERPANVAAEHASLLDILVDRAFSEGCTHVATFDMDSWPIQKRWDRLYRSVLTKETPVAAVVRTELQDNFPSPLFTMMRAGFWRRGKSSFGLGQRGRFTPQARRLSSRPGESGSGILAQLHDAGLSFHRLERSNSWDVHPVMAALYDNTIFHLGAGSRAPRFRSDHKAYQPGRSPIRRRFADQMNEACQAFTLAEVLNRHDEFVAELAGKGARPLKPIETDPKALPKTMTLTPAARRQRWSVNRPGGTSGSTAAPRSMPAPGPPATTTPPRQRTLRSTGPGRGGDQPD